MEGGAKEGRGVGTPGGGGGVPRAGGGVPGGRGGVPGGRGGVRLKISTYSMALLVCPIKVA